MFQLLQSFGSRKRLRPYFRLRFGAITLSIFSGMASSLLFAASAQAAERIRLRFGLAELVVTQQELETFAATGAASGDLEIILSRLEPDLQDQFQAALTANYELDPVLANRFSYTRSGEQLLTEVGELIQTESGLNGFKGLRAALTLAAADPEGLTILKFIESFPTDIQLDIGQALQLGGRFRSLLADTQQTVTQLKAETVAIAQIEPTVDFSTLPDPRALGDRTVSMETMTLFDEARDRTIPVDIYTPNFLETDAERSVPVIVVSNGLGARRDRFTELANHLASHGFVVALPDHPGSDRERLSDFYDGLESENFEPAEYIDRPLDISFILDELARTNAAQFGNRLNPEQAGVFGYSFGGTTALALAGAEIDLEHLQQSCETRSSLFNISLLYQCRALELSESAIASAKLKDDRIKAIYTFVPFSRSLYGPDGMAKVEGPVLWEATDKDILTPFVVEQLPAFGWLTGLEEMSEESRSEESQPEEFQSEERLEAQSEGQSDRYLAVTTGLPHARITLEVLDRLTGQDNDWEGIRAIAENYHQRLNTAFFKVHLAGDETYRPYLQAQGAQYLSQEPYPLTWTDSVSEESILEE
ncbi:alpha/beta hydrolase [cf. Phormidesmis sp. LEGE 11477]|uniref:alpha/beta hydrolase n=1 Tax=cf. Phormidesmis sp. LEGE 11477 TaxID=1828680 RepID=UPI001882789D|nr:alpha/beta hydrolase [cf. Phormidesmis sp. LEGE 11477]MBE9064037.1 alpha/beta hydrolase [cf. Phormidesmis sp. LEGE 11477]